VVNPLTGLYLGIWTEETKYGAFALINGALAPQLGDLAIWTCIEGFYPTEFS